MKSQKISTTQLAKICGVSQGTVDRALNNRPGINPQTKEKVLRIAKQYGFRLKNPEREASGKPSMMIGIVVFDLVNPYFAHIVTEIEQLCSEKGYDSVITFTDTNPKREIECIDNLYRMNVDAIVMCPVNSGEEFENYLLSLELPIVTVGNRLNRIPFIGIDNREAIYKMIDFILSKGYDRIIYVQSEPADSQYSFAQQERLKAFRRAAEEKHFDCCITDVSGAEQKLEPGRKNVFLCATDFTAIRLFEPARKAGTGIIGIDNVWLIDLFGLKLDSLSYDIKLTARSVVEYLIDGKPATEKIECEIVKRGSV